MQRRSRKSSYGGLKDSKSSRKTTLEQIVDDSSFEWLPHEDTFDRILNAEACLQVQSKDDTKVQSLSESKDDTDVHSSSESKEIVSSSSGIFYYADQENKDPVRSPKSAVRSNKKPAGSRKSSTSAAPSSRSRRRKSKAVPCAHTLSITPAPASTDDQTSAAATEPASGQRGDSHVYSSPFSEVVRSSPALSAAATEPASGQRGDSHVYSSPLSKVVRSSPALSAAATESVNGQRGDSHVYSSPFSEVARSSPVLSASGGEDVPLSAVTVRPASTPFVAGAATRLFLPLESPVPQRSPSLERSLGRCNSLQSRWPNVDSGVSHLISPAAVKSAKKCRVNSDHGEGADNRCVFGIGEFVIAARDVEVEINELSVVGESPAEAKVVPFQRSPGVLNVMLELPDAAAVSEPDIVSRKNLSDAHGDSFKGKEHGHRSILNSMVFNSDGVNGVADHSQRELVSLSFNCRGPKAETHESNSSEHRGKLLFYKIDLADDTGVSPAVLSATVDNTNVLVLSELKGLKVSGSPECSADSIDNDGSALNKDASVEISLRSSSRGAILSEMSGVLADDSWIDQQGIMSYSPTDVVGVSEASCGVSAVDVASAAVPTCRVCVSRLNRSRLQAPMSDGDIVSGIESTTQLNRRGAESTMQVKKNGVASSTQVKKNGVASSTQVNKNGVASSTQVKKNGVASSTQVKKNGVASSTQVNKNGVASSTQVKKNGIASSTQVKKNGVASSTQVNKNGVASSTQVKKNGVASSTQVKKNGLASSTQVKRRGAESSTDVKKNGEESSLPDADSAVSAAQSVKQCRVRLSLMTESRLRSVFYPVNSVDASAVAAPHFETPSRRCRSCSTDDRDVDAGNGSNRSTNSSVCSSDSSSPVQPVDFSCLVSLSHVELLASPPGVDGWRSTEVRSSSRQAVLDGSYDPASPAGEDPADSAAGAARIQSDSESVLPRPDTTGPCVSVDPCTPNARRTGRPDASLVQAVGGGTPLLATRRGKGWRRSLVICSPLVRPTDRRRSRVLASQLLPPQRLAAAALVSQPLSTGVVMSQRRLSAARPLQTPADRAAFGASRRQRRRYSLAIDESRVAEGYNSVCAPVRRSSFYVTAAHPIIPGHVAPSDLSSPNTPSICRAPPPLGTPAAKAVPDAETAVLRLCSDRQVISFTTFLRRARISRKVGEGVYGEVFLCGGAGNKQMTVVKIMPIEGDRVVNEAAQKTYGEILSEILISKKLSDLRHDRSCRTSGFVELVSCHVVKGRYPHRLRQSWLRYHKEKGSENEDPRCFDPDQLFLVLEYAHAGTDLEGYTFDTPAQALSAFIQVAFSLAVAECALRFEHRDLHWGNVLLKPVVTPSDPDDRDSQRVICELAGRRLSVPSCGVRATLIDFTLSRMSSPADGDDGARVIFNNLEEDEELFNSYGDYQFDIYRNMRQVTGGQWWLYRPYTNVQWLHYLLDKMCVDVLYSSAGGPRDHRRQMRRLSQLRDSLLQAESATQLLLQRFNQLSEELVALTTAS